MVSRGHLIVLEGPNEIGKTTLAWALTDELNRRGIPATNFSLPGGQPGSLGHLVYRIHHKDPAIDLNPIGALSIQLLHVAAHADAVQTQILPALERGQTVVLDRFWWSMWVYGKAASVPDDLLRSMVELERRLWGDVRPAPAILLERDRPWPQSAATDAWQSLVAEYSRLAAEEASRHEVMRVSNDSAVEAIARSLADRLVEARPRSDGSNNQLGEALAISTASGLYQATRAARAVVQDEPQRMSRAEPSTALRPLATARTTEVFDAFWKFAAERQAVFFRRLEGQQPPWTDDAIIAAYRFTNAYRASDRVSQYLIRKVIYQGDQRPDEIFFRTILFKLFNRIGTWELLEGALGPLNLEGFTPERYGSVLSEALSRGEAIYSAAYIMPTAGRGTERKHVGHLRLLQHLLRNELPWRLQEASSLREAFEMLRAYPMMGDFLAYQYVIDLNYSDLLHFSEMEFVVPGPGARSGLRRCFTDAAGLSESDLIRLVTERQAEEFAHRGLQFRTLWGRPLQLIDCQNLFCEIDKYSRVAYPALVGQNARTRIKRRFRPERTPISAWYPPKWSLNKLIDSSLRDTDALLPSQNR